MSENPQIPDSTEEDILLDHNYDGIQEFDNPLPGWWKAIFWGTILFCVPYTWWYHLADGNTVYDKLDADVAAKEARIAAQPKADTGAEGMMAMLQDSGALARGKGLFLSKGCSACHAPDGGGVAGLGANLTDDRWKNVKTIEDIVSIVTNGVPGTAMVAQTALLSENEIAEVAAFVASLRGTTPANPKEAEGELIPAWGE